MDYKNGKIYKIVSDLTDLIYIGSTCSPLSKRHYGHKKSFKTGKKTCTSIELIKLGETRIELIEDYPCERIEQLNAREGYHIKLNKDICVNRNIAGRTRKEWVNDNKDDIKEKRKEFYEANKAKILESNKKYREDNNAKILESKKKYREDNNAKITEYKKKYDAENKVKNAEYAKQYREKNKDENSF